MLGTDAPPPGTEVGTLAVVLHSHLPWVLHHGRWPVGEEWLHQAWAQCYLPLVRELRALADEGRTGLVTLGVTPVLASQLDDAAALRGVGAWVADWLLRAQQLAARSSPAEREIATHEFRSATAALADLAGPWRAGGSAVLRELASSGVVELLGGPATHPFLPLLEPEVARLALRVGLDDARWRTGAAPQGIWSPECGHRPGLEQVYAGLGVGHAVYDEATFAASGASVHAGRRMAGTDVVAVARDLEVTDRVWSSRTGYPGGAAYRDFHALDPDLGLRLHAVTGPGEKRWWAPDDAAAQVARDAAHFVAAVQARLVDVAARDGRPGLVVVAWDTELFGHWWHEGPQFLAAVLRLLPAAGVRVATLTEALRPTDGHRPLVDGEIDLAPGSWGAGKDFSVWAGEPVRELASSGRELQRRLLRVLDGVRLDPAAGRRPDLDQLVRQALLTLSSDWAFMVTRDQAPDYALRREAAHRAAFHRLADLVGAAPSGHASSEAREEAARQREADGPFPALDARSLF